jgi:flagellar biosynthesis regulator FlaF
LHLAARGAQVQEVLDRAVAALQAVQATAEAMRTQAHAHAWLPPTWRDAIEAVHRDNVRTLARLLARLQGVAEGFADAAGGSCAGCRGAGRGPDPGLNLA